MRYLTPVSILLITLVFVTSCSTRQTMVKEQISDHPHYFPNVKNAGSFHVMNFMNRRASKIGIQILDRYEEPFYLDLPKIKAKINRSNGMTKSVWLYGEGYIPEVWEGEPFGGELNRGATIFSRSFEWVKNEHNAKLTVWIPLPDGNTYELDFDCIARSPLPPHSGLLQK